MIAREHNARELATKAGQNFDALDQVMKNAYLHNADVEMARQPEGTGSIDTSASGELLFSLVGKRTETPVDVLWERVKRLGAATMVFPHTVTMPCGNRAIFDDAEHIQGLGIEDIKCRCGDPTHYLVKFEDRRELEIFVDPYLKPEKPIKLPKEVVNNDSDSGTGQLNIPDGSPDTGKPEQPEKPKAKRKSRKRTKKVL